MNFQYEWIKHLNLFGDELKLRSCWKKKERTNLNF